MKFVKAGIALTLVGLFAGMTLDHADAQKKKKQEEEKSEPAPSGAPTPDLYIIDSETVIKAGGCSKEEPLITGTVAIKNKGNGRADRLVAHPITAVYVPENLDVKDEDIVPNSLAPLELFSTDIQAGKGVIKTGRGFDGERKVYIVVDPYNEISESNEKNNLLVRTVKFKCK